MDANTTMQVNPKTGWIFPLPVSFATKKFRLLVAAVVYAWPSTGGRIELRNPSAFELCVLGINDHFSECTRSSDPAEEDAFVDKERRLGGIFFEYGHGKRRGENERHEILAVLGWPEDQEHRGGVWVLRGTKSEMSGKRAGRVRLATSMEDRCRAIEMCGGVFYQVPPDEHLVPLGPISEGERNRVRNQSLSMELEQGRMAVGSRIRSSLPSTAELQLCTRQ
jgi:hypothetical protein